MIVGPGRWIQTHMVQNLDTQLRVRWLEIQDERSAVIRRQDLGQGPNGFRLIRCVTSVFPQLVGINGHLVHEVGRWKLGAKRSQVEVGAWVPRVPPPGQLTAKSYREPKACTSGIADVPVDIGRSHIPGAAPPS